MVEKFVKTYGTYRKPVIFKKYRDTFEVIVEFNDCGGDKASVYVRKWNGRSWNHVAKTKCTKEEANNIARKIIETNEISIEDFE
jgi:hypothetical protein